MWRSGLGMIEINSPVNLAISSACVSAKPMANGVVNAVASVCPNKVIHLGGSPDFDGEIVDFPFLWN